MDIWENNLSELKWDLDLLDQDFKDIITWKTRKKFSSLVIQRSFTRAHVTWKMGLRMELLLICLVLLQSKEWLLRFIPISVKGDSELNTKSFLLPTKKHTIKNSRETSSNKQQWIYQVEPDNTSNSLFFFFFCAPLMLSIQFFWGKNYDYLNKRNIF